MKAVGPLFLILIPSIFLCQERPKQEVTVTAVEVPVRVLRQGETVKGLSKEDFEVYENGIKQEVTALEVVSRTISLDKEIPPSDLKSVPRKRLFFLIFDIFDYSDSVGQAIDYFFQTIFRPEDDLILMTEDRLLEIDREKGLEVTTRQLKETLKKYKVISTMNTNRAYRELKFEADRLLGRMKTSSDWDTDATVFLNNYKRIWLDYRRRFLYPDLDLYRAVIKRVKQREGQKWAICFQQRDLFPQIKNQGELEKSLQDNAMGGGGDPELQTRARHVMTMYSELQRSFDYSQNFPSEKLRDLFMESGITFHLILMKSLRSLYSEDFELKEVVQDYEACLKKISDESGGYSTFSNNVLAALKEASAKEDYHYLVAYSPKDSAETKERKIKVKVKRENVDVVSLKEFIAREQPLITISDFQASQKTIKFSLKSYALIEREGKRHGLADVKIILFDDTSTQVVSEAKTLDLLKAETVISLNFSQLKSGVCFIIIEAFDRVSGGKDVFSKLVEL